MVKTDDSQTREHLTILTITDSHGMVVLSETVRKDDAEAIIAKFLSTIR
jgi:selenocysteine-specific translation elongation factor